MTRHSDPTLVMPSAATQLRARWVLPVASPPIPNGIIECAAGRILSIGPSAGREPVDAIPEIAIVPAFVNAHTHLEFSSLVEPFGGPRRSFADWIRQVIAWRHLRDQVATGGQAARGRAIQAGIAEARATGTYCLGEIASSGCQSADYPAAGMAGVLFRELIALAPERISAAIEQAEEFLDETAAGSAIGLRRGLSPHAPYTAHPELVRRLVRVSSRRRVPVAMHLAETPEELQLLRAGTGPLRELLIGLNAWAPGAIPLDSRPLDYLKILSHADHALVIHGNYLEADEHEYLASHRDRMTVVFCPRTHAWFGHQPYPLWELIERGVRVAIGTDSRASNPDLSMLPELRFVAQHYRQIGLEELLRMGSLHGATALGLESEFGTLQPGKRAAFACLPLPQDRLDDPYSWLQSPSG